MIFNWMDCNLKNHQRLRKYEQLDKNASLSIRIIKMRINNKQKINYQNSINQQVVFSKIK